MEKAGIWSRLKGLFLLAWTMFVTVKGSAVYPAKHLVGKIHEDNMRAIEDKRRVVGNIPRYPSPKFCFIGV